MGLEVSKKNYQREILNLKQSEFRSLLSEVYVNAYLNEGIFDGLLDFLGKLAGAYASGASSVNLDRRLPVDDRIDPKNNVQDQVHALVCVLQSVGYAVDGLTRDLDYLEEQIEQPWDEMDANTFIAKAQLYIETGSGAYGSFHAWIGAGSRGQAQLAQCSRKVHEIGQRLEEAPEVLHFGMRLLDDAMGELASLNIPAQANTIIQQEEAQKMMEDDPNLKKYIDECIPLVAMIPELRPRVRVVAENTFEIEELMKAKQAEPVEADSIG